MTERATPGVPLSKMDEFLFAPQSTAPMTLVRIIWGAMTAVWALSLIPDVDPFFTTGKLRYEHQLGGMRPTEVVLIDAVNSNLATTINYSDYRFQEIPDAWFQRDYLPRLRAE